MNNTYRRVGHILGVAIAIAALSSIGYQLWQTLPQLRGTAIQPLPAVLAFLCLCCISVLLPLLWRHILQRMQTPLGLLDALRIWNISQIVRYAPGNVWYLLGRVYLARQQGIPTQPVSISLVYELLFTITAGLVVMALSLPFWEQQTAFGLWVLLLIPLLALLLFPSLLKYPFQWALRLTRQQPAEHHLYRRDLLLLLPGYCVVWLFYGTALYLLARAIHPLPLANLPALIGIFAIGWVVGFLSFITPSGLGVREGVLGYLLSFLMPLPVALLLALLDRVWITLAEVLCAALAFWGRKPAPTPAEPDPLR